MINKDISVIIPAYNCEKTICRCLESIRQQSLTPLEIIVVDDNSIDHTVKLVEGLATVISNTHKKGPGGARNTGAYVAKADILAYIDSDCIAPKDWLKNISFVFCDPEVVAVGGGYCSGFGNGFWQTFCFEELAFRRKNYCGAVNTLVSCNFACRKSIFLEERGFPEQYPVCEDMLLSYRVSGRGKVIWLGDNGVQHHFKDSFREYLKHQYFFGAESAKFFLENPKLLTVNQHQGRVLYLAFTLALLSFANILITAIFIVLGNLKLSLISIALSIFLVLTHAMLYLTFILYLIKKNFKNIIKIYAVSFLRDLICAFSLIDGIACAIIKRKN